MGLMENDSRHRGSQDRMGVIVICTGPCENSLPSHSDLLVFRAVRKRRHAIRCSMSATCNNVGAYHHMPYEFETSWGPLHAGSVHECVFPVCEYELLIMDDHIPKDSSRICILQMSAFCLRPTCRILYSASMAQSVSGQLATFCSWPTCSILSSANMQHSIRGTGQGHLGNN